jgi:hypothetical protein
MKENYTEEESNKSNVGRREFLGVLGTATTTVIGGCSALGNNPNEPHEESKQDTAYETVTPAEYRTREEFLQDVRIEIAFLDYEDRNTINIAENPKADNPGREKPTELRELNALVYTMEDESGDKVDEAFIPADVQEDKDAKFGTGLALEGSMVYIVEDTYDTTFQIDNVDTDPI